MVTLLYKKVSDPTLLLRESLSEKDQERCALPFIPSLYIYLWRTEENTLKRMKIPPMKAPCSLLFTS
jgi:hypothetical protein